MSEELKPCPFCGGEAETNMILFDSKEIISCSNRKCYAHYTGFTTTRKAWNTRPIEDALRAENERLRALTEWQDIKSCPHEFRFLLRKGNDVVIAQWSKIQACFWNEADNEFIDDITSFDGWMPLPKAPQIEEK